jgi:copper chaperone
MNVSLRVSGMTCGHCKAAVEAALKRVPGVEAVTVDLAGGVVDVRGGELTPAALLAAVVEEGYEASLQHA